MDFNTEKSLQFATKLYWQCTETRKEIRNHVFIKYNNEKVTFSLRFPNVGLYLFSIFAQRKNMEMSLVCVFNYVIEVTQSLVGCKPYPKCYSLWDEGCVIYDMLDGVVPTEEDLRVAVKVPNATDVVVIEEQKWHNLRRVSIIVNNTTALHVY